MSGEMGRQRLGGLQLQTERRKILVESQRNLVSCRRDLHNPPERTGFRKSPDNASA